LAFEEKNYSFSIKKFKKTEKIMRILVYPVLVNVVRGKTSQEIVLVYLS